jgi:uncharacterized protein (TIGR03435 family)
VNRRMCSMLLAVGLCASAQDKKLEFDVASVRTGVVPRSPATGTGRPGPMLASSIAELEARVEANPPFGGPGSSDPERMTLRGLTMEALILTAFTIHHREQISAPDSIQKWLSKNRFDIVAKVPLGATREDANEMLKNLLVERFGLAYHMEKRDFDGYRLTVAKGGSKLKPAAPTDGPQKVLPLGTRQPLDEEGFPIFQPGYPNLVGAGRDGVIHFAGRMVTTEDLLIDLGFYLRVGVFQVEDKTGLTSKYDLKLQFADPRGRGTVAAAAGAPIDLIGDPAPDLFTALEKQLGLKLEKIKVPTDVVVIDHLNQQPTDN